MSLFDPQQIVSLEMRDFVGRYISTGSPVLDLIIGCAVFRLILYATNLAEHPIGLSFLMDYLPFWRSEDVHRGQLEFSFAHEGTTRRKSYGDLAPGYKGVLHRIAQIKDGRIWKLRETSLSYYDSEQEKTVEEQLYEVRQDEVFELDKKIFAKVTDSEDVQQTRNGGETRKYKRTIVIYSDEYDAAALKQLVAAWIEQYNDFKRLQLESRRLIFQIRFNEEEDKKISSCDFHTFRSFDNLIFEHKAEVLKEVDFFMSQQSWYEQRGLPYTLGILCYGEPGCGKTSFIKALLRHTNRHAVVFSINKFTNLSVIEELMRTEKIDDFPIKQEERIYVLEDIDAMGDIVTKRDSDEDEVQGPKTLEEEALVHLDPATLLGAGKSKKGKKNSKGRKEARNEANIMDMLMDGMGKKKENHLGFLLNVLDGVIECPGRFVVMTTNFVDKLDPALIRPGRIDIKLEFQRCSRTILHKILSQFYEKDPDSWELPSIVADGMFTPARVGQLCRCHKRSFTKLLETLCAEAQDIKDKEAEAAAQGRKEEDPDVCESDGYSDPSDDDEDDDDNDDNEDNDEDGKEDEQEEERADDASSPSEK